MQIKPPVPDPLVGALNAGRTPAPAGDKALNSAQLGATLTLFQRKLIREVISGSRNVEDIAKQTGQTSAFVSRQLEKLFELFHAKDINHLAVVASQSIAATSQK